MKVLAGLMCVVLGLLSWGFGASAVAQSLPAQPSIVLPSIAVSEVRTAHGVVLPPNYSAYALTREIESALDATRKFRVVSRSAGEGESFADELQFTRRGSVAAQAATYLMSIEVLGGDLKEERRPVPNLYGKYSRQTVGRIEVRVSVRKTADGSIQSRFPIDARASTAPEVYDGSGAPTAGGTSLGFVDLAKAAGKKLADRVLDELYPVLVINRQGTIVFLNRGEDSGYRVGEVLRVFSGEGGRLIDPYTKEDLGPLETQLGTIRVTDMRPRSTMAEVVSETAAIGQGAIVRKSAERQR